MEYKNFFLLNGRDKPNIDKYHKKINILAINANVAIHNKKFAQDISANYNTPLIIDPMTYLLQANIKNLCVKNKKTNKQTIKPSILKLLQEMYKLKLNINDLDENDSLFNQIDNSIDKLIKNIFKFQSNFFSDIELGAFENKTKAKYLSAPYFDVIDHGYLNLNKKILNNKFYSFDLFRIVVSKKTQPLLLDDLIKEVNKSKIPYIEIWVESQRKNDFPELINKFKKILNKKIIFKFISFKEMIIIRNNFMKNVYGFITAFGYGESRNIYPIGGGLPVNKIYSLQRRTRIRITEFFDDISKKKIDHQDPKDGDKYLSSICNCSICEEIITQYGLPYINLFAEHNDYKLLLKNGMSSKRIAATQKAQKLTNYHYIENKLTEYKDFFSEKGFTTKWYNDYFLNKK